MKPNKEGFFRISSENIGQLYKQGADALTLCAYLVIACGTGRDNATSTWSAEAVRKYVGCRPGTAKLAIEKLIEMGCIALHQERTKPGRPVYVLLNSSASTTQEIWLPNALVRGATDEAPYPLATLREGGDPLRVRLLLDMYAAHELLDSGGVDVELIQARFNDVEALGQKNGATAFRFSDGKYSADKALSEPHGEHVGGSVPAAFWERFRTLRSLGFIEEVFVLLDGPGGEPLYCYGPTEDERASYQKLRAHALGFFRSRADDLPKGEVLPVPQHIKNPVLQGVLRMKFRPHTKVTSAWWAQSQQANAAYLRRFGLLDVMTTDDDFLL